ncbi:MAG: phosphonate ABC transporter ATP-binding protein [Burkholderiaceae bacterium]
MSTAIRVSEISKTFGSHRALDRVGFSVREGETVALLGASGSGKSTLLRILSGLEIADRGAGEVEMLGQSLQAGGRLCRDIRRQRSQIATIFQQFNLVDRLPVMINVLAGGLHRHPAWRNLLRRFPRDEYIRAWEALARVGIENCAWQRASTLSGGQQQRAAISRAIVQGARMVLADEPIASLDPESSHRVMGLLTALAASRQITVVVSLHQVDFAFAYCARTIALRDGRIVYDGDTRELTPQRLRSLYGTQSESMFNASSPAVSTVGPRVASATA